MAIAHQFEYFKPKSLTDALGLLARFKGQGSLLAGGTDLINWIKEDFLAPDAVIDIKGITELKALEIRGDHLFVGALVTFRELLDSSLIKEKFPLIWEQSGVVACHGVRNRATMVGNICSGVPCCDSGPVLQVYNAVVLLADEAGERRVPILDWFVAPKKTARKDTEVVMGVEIPLTPGKSAGCYVKLGRYDGEDLAQASVALLALEDGDIRVSFGSVGPTPIRSTAIEAVLKGKSISDDLLTEVENMVDGEISPISDVRATREYRSLMTKVMLKRGLQAVTARLSGSGPAYGHRLI